MWRITSSGSFTCWASHDADTTSESRGSAIAPFTASKAPAANAHRTHSRDERMDISSGLRAPPHAATTLVVDNLQECFVECQQELSSPLEPRSGGWATGPDMAIG